jgi:cytochrome oxidase Cu insertion factor (SCO1/SenC/PrrC family)
MKERRKFLQALPATALGASVLGWLKGVAQPHAAKALDPRKQRSIPNIAGVAHTGQEFRLYQDLVKDKVVTINFMSIRDEAHYPVTSRMLEIARRLGNKLGREIFMISVTRDPEHDTPERLAAFVAERSIPKGWLFVNCAQEGVNALHARIYHSHHAPTTLASPHSEVAHAAHFRSTDTVFYGNGGIGLWSNFAVELRPDEAVRHIAWVMPGRKPGADSMRAGPRRLSSPGLPSDNRIA